MPTLTRWFLRAALLYLVAALGLGLVMALPGSPPLFGPWFAPYIHFLVLGWASQMIFGVSLWMFPRRRPLDLAAIPWLEWFCFVTLNAGLLIRGVAEPALAQRPTPLDSTGVVVAAVLQLAAVVAFVILVWPRIWWGTKGGPGGMARR